MKNRSSRGFDKINLLYRICIQLLEKGEMRTRNSSVLSNETHVLTIRYVCREYDAHNSPEKTAN